MSDILEKMDDFFTSRLDGYDEHMLNYVKGCREGYVVAANSLPRGITNLLDLGCGTGLELAPIFERTPDLAVTGVDLSAAMLGRLKEKFADKNIDLIHSSYIGMDFGTDKFDAAISFESLHHLNHSEKAALYKKLYASLIPGGIYVEGDYMVRTQSEEDELFAENARLRHIQNIPAGEYYHFDTPCTINNQITMLRKAGFGEVTHVWREGGTSIIVARKLPRIISVRKYPEYTERAVNFFSSKFNISHDIYDNCIANSLGSRSPLPQWYLMTDNNDNIIGGAGIIPNDFVSRMDIGPYLCALYVEEEWRGRGLAGLLIKRIESDAAALGFENLYLCTDHTSFYERYGWHFIGYGFHPSGDKSRIYMSRDLSDNKK